MDHVELTHSAIDVNQISKLIGSKNCGAQSIFIGTTREDGDDVKVEKLVYEAYESMAIKMMKTVCGELRAKWPLIENVAICHRLGSVPVGETSIVIAVSSPHRKDALEAVHFAIDRCKAVVPIWKKEVFSENGISRWMENKECEWSSSNAELTS
ncbi:unnamed protein product [Bemisia tabaci]|uniref:Molybdopterin synthase catalytic subunit n=1 Tax=Bemisia tabaci TaxID=7038 RepID=A0A9P0F473_BEMTA|nr:PREDICTED: molybdopterin synthase catalytic subunit 2 [Bemisia tabaci]CAH0391266.1 unnamed protein product [Bemisia tabaci]